MKTKERKSIHLKITLKKCITFFAFLLGIIYSIIFYNYYFTENKVYATQTTSSEATNTKISNAKEIDIQKIIEENYKQNQKEEFTTEEIDLEYMTTYRSNASLPKGMLQVAQEGREGKQKVTIKHIYENGELISEEQISSKITKASVNKIVEVGTANYTSNYKVKIGDTVYVTSDRLSVMIEANEQSQKIATLKSGDELKVTEIQGAWYKIISGSTVGYVKTEATTYINNNIQNEENSQESQKSKTQLTNNLDINMQLNKPSGLTLEQFKKVLSDSKDVNKIFENNAQYFYYIEKQYNINGIFVASVGIHESGWGTSKICKEKNNLFGYGAYDSSPYNSAYNFSNYSECIDLIARVFVKYYLNPSGTSIYGGETASGKYYNGATLKGVNTRYATDKNWANSVYTYMKYLYNKLYSIEE